MVQQAALPGRFEPVVSVEQEEAKYGYRLFKHIRSGAANTSSPTLGRTLELMLITLRTHTFEHPVPPADADALLLLAETHDWEGTYERAQAEQDLGPEDRDLREHLLWLRERLPGYKAAIEHLSDGMTESGFATWDDARTGEKIWGTYFEAVKKQTELDTHLRARIDAHKQVAVRAARIDQVYAGLLAHYGGRGPQYDVTCRTLATITADIEAIRRPGIQATQEGVETLQKLVLLQQGLVNQLQKFTESTKVDSTSGESLRELAQAIAECALRPLMNTQPELANRIVEDMQRELLARGVPGVQAGPDEISPPKQAEEIAS